MGLIDVAVKNPPSNYIEFMELTSGSLDSKTGDVFYGMRSKIGVLGFVLGIVMLSLLKSVVNDAHKPSRRVFMIIGLITTIGIPAISYRFGVSPDIIVPPIVGAFIAIGLIFSSEKVNNT